MPSSQTATASCFVFCFGKRKLATALPHFDNYIYNGTKIGTKANLIAALADAENWYGSNDSADVTLSMESFTVEDFDEISGAFFSLADGM